MDYAPSVTRHAPILLAAALLCAACTPEAGPPAREPSSHADSAPKRAATSVAAATAAEAPRKRPPLDASAVHDDVPAAMERAKAEGKVVLVDAWAPWCHTCLSMKHYVIGDPSLAPLADRVIVAEIDTDRPENAAFLEKHAVSVWPTYFMIDPATDRVVGYWTGAASVREMRGFIEESLRALDDARAASDPAGSPSRDLLEAKAAHAAGDYPRAARAYEKAIAKAPADWPRRSEALLGLIHALHRAKDWGGCARVGKAHAPEVKGAAVPADFSAYLLACTSKLPAGPEQTAARQAAIERLKALTANPPEGSSADDRADALALLAGGLKDAGDTEGARKANEARIAVLERAAKEAPTPEAAATFDYARAGAYMALGRGEEAVRMLEQREREMPESYEPPARLADTLAKMNRPKEALAAIDRAIARAYGPRKLRYLALRAELQGKLGDAKGQIATLREEVTGHEALGKGHADAERLSDARKRLDEAEKRAAQKR